MMLKGSELTFSKTKIDFLLRCIHHFKPNVVTIWPKKAFWVLNPHQ